MVPSDTKAMHLTRAATEDRPRRTSTSRMPNGKQNYNRRCARSGLKVDQAKRLKDLVKENPRLREPVAIRELDLSQRFAFPS